ncbi:MAG: hypothetical protein A2887_06575 [Alphaproteobacteria bacterium RIFCSPLOWO2_01_FULL_40_26]|nr:MAG: hypothetical protein A3D15_04125 [Alphaproteobacteria bacterium RIFCSPHIGHO2_02_FULL_40_34]OFW94084.1 MAG: hypothetical protein A2887_06575 [Alphaproteobacteria bacterium RIFCSPLOWO2_01_FULL_40_26]OFX09584.1 MAG: hypothetical protein A3H30_00015 [Alphaproteobacteria bacterium RIFCSPLOWO2_02_FULL_40_19]OFX11245.1 MAG: hypothetical protein A3G22_00600 [Alphaproteobacteria bacterium RIFCSPLOWO2_12_FULL_40_11]
MIGLKKKHLDELLHLLALYLPDEEVWAYGSRIDGTAHEASDLDLVTRNPKDPNKRNEKIFELREALSESNIPLIIDIHDWASLPENFHKNIEKKYLVIQSKNS